MRIYKEARMHFKNLCWTANGKIIVHSDGAKVVIGSSEQLTELIVRKTVYNDAV